MDRGNWRRRPDLNRGWRFCRPLPYHLATAPSSMLCGSEKRERTGLSSVVGATTTTATVQTVGSDCHTNHPWLAIAAGTANLTRPERVGHQGPHEATDARGVL